MIRSFVGAPLPAAYQDLLEKIAGARGRSLRSKLAWTRKGSWHLTLKFLGERPQSEVDEIRRALAGVDFAPFDVKAGGVGFFPPLARQGKRGPRVLWVGLSKGREETIALAGKIERVLAPLGIEPEARPFSPHLTLARVKRAESDDWAGLAGELERIEFPGFRLDRFVLWRSTLTPRGPVYSKLAEFPARGCGPAA